MARKTKSEARATRERLLDAAEEIFVEKGVAHSSLEEIARRAGMTRGALYWHFDNKTDLFSAVVERVRPPLAELLDTGAGDEPLTALRGLCLQSLQQLADNPHHQRVYTILLHRCEFMDDVNPYAQRHNAMVAETLTIIEEYFRRAATQGQFNPALTPDTAARALYAFMLGLYSDWLRHPARFDIAERADDLLAAFFEGVERR